MAVCHGNESLPISLGPVPTRAEEVERLGEEIVVQETSVDRKCTHHKDDITTTKRQRLAMYVRESLQNLQEECSQNLSKISSGQLTLRKDHQ